MSRETNPSLKAEIESLKQQLIEAQRVILKLKEIPPYAKVFPKLPPFGEMRSTLYKKYRVDSDNMGCEGGFDTGWQACLDHLTTERLEDESVSNTNTEPVHTWFELSYAQYLTIPRSVLQEMPEEWQQRFVDCLEELDDTLDWRPKEGRYWVKLKDGNGRYARDPFMDYRRHPKIPRKWK